MHANVVHCKRKAHDVYIGRPSEWGNPWSHLDNTVAKYKVDTRQQSIDNYRKFLWQNTTLLNKLIDLKGKILGCWCSPQSCHGDIIADLASRIEFRANTPVLFDNTQVLVVRIEKVEDGVIYYKTSNGHCVPQEKLLAVAL